MKTLLTTLAILLFTITPSQAADTLNVRSYVDRGEAYLGKPWTVLPVTEFARFRRDGNRVGYERKVFARRRQLAVLAMAEIIERKGRFVNDIIDGLEAMMEEPFWGIPAHYGPSVPVYSSQPVDLFNAEAASLIAWIGHELRPELDKFSPQLHQKIEKEIKYRILDRALGSNDWWKKAGMNWNTWICSNWLTCVMLYERDSTRRHSAVQEIEGCMRAFIDLYPDDGGCDEGTGYWDRAAASLFDCLNIMRTLRDDSLMTDISILDYKKEKVARMGAYIYNMYIGNGYDVNFADAHTNKSVAQLNVLWPFALYLDDKQMQGYAAWIAKEKDFWHNPAALYASESNYPVLGRELTLLKNVDKLAQVEPVEPHNEAWLSDLQIATMRSKSFFVAMKGGHNGESHNHNDVGSYIVYADGEPLLIDCGVGEYTQTTFSNNRYSIWTMQSGYHNLPQINGVDQKDGKQFHAEVVRKEQRALTLDIAKAYPPEAHVDSWIRRVGIKGNVVEVTERYRLSQFTSPTRLMFITSVRPDVTKAGSVQLGNYRIAYSPQQIDVTVEDISSLLDGHLSNTWGPSLYRIIMTLRGEALQGKVSYTITR